MKSLEFKASHDDGSFFYLAKDGNITILIVYVDGIQISGNIDKQRHYVVKIWFPIWGTCRGR